MTFNFPKTRFVKENGLVAQFCHIETEVSEVHEVILTPDIQATAMEIMDVLHSTETALRILQEKYGINLSELRRDVERKNWKRGYYDLDTP